MKRLLSILMVVTLLLGLTGCNRMKYSDVYKALEQETWFCKSVSSRWVNVFTFSKKGAFIDMFYNGDQGFDFVKSKKPYKYNVNDTEIIISLDEENTWDIPYTWEDGKVVPNEKFFTLEQIEAELQGCWGVTKHTRIAGTTDYLASEYVVSIDAGKITYKYADHNDFHGPYTGTYTIDKEGIHATFSENAPFQVGVNFILDSGYVQLTIAGDLAYRYSNFAGEDFEF